MDQKDQARVKHAGQVMAYYAEKINDLFNRPMKITILARDPDNPQMELLITDDDIDQAIEALKRAKDRKPL